MRITRRDFLGWLGSASAGLALGVDAVAADPSTGSTAGATDKDSEILGAGPFIQIGSDGVITLVIHRSEMGQGIRSSIPVLVADELGADPTHIRLVQADGDPRFGDQNTDGSTSIRKGWDDIRRLGATARAMLVTAAAQQWGVPPAGLVAKMSVVTDPATGRNATFGELAVLSATITTAPLDVQLRPDTELERVGTDQPLLDARAYVTGEALFGADIRLPGMLVAVIARPPVFGGRAVRYDPSAALAIPGVRQVIGIPRFSGAAHFKPLGGVAVLADDTWTALRGRKALVIEWDHGDHAEYDTEAYNAELSRLVSEPGRVFRETGDADKALKGAAKVIDGEYHNPHLVHLPMEPPAALARMDGGKVEIWAPSQDPQGARKAVAQELGIQEEDITIHVTFLGGGFGRKSKADFVAEAAVLARDAGVPVRVQWTREDEIRHGYYHSTCTQRIEAGLDADGKVIAWRHRVAFPSIASIMVALPIGPVALELQQGLLDLPLAVPDVRMEVHHVPAHVRIGWMRSVHNVNAAFSVQSFVDELAAATGRDPKATLLDLLGPPRDATQEELGSKKLPNYEASLEEHPVDVARLRGVIERVTASAGWDGARAAGRAVGLAAHRSFLAYVAVVASVKHGANGRVDVDEVWIAADCGRIVNRDRVRAQMEGAVIFGMTTALYGEITAKGGEIEQHSFRDHRIVRMPEAPVIHVDIVQSTEPPAGVGEPGVPPVAPAIANAFFALTGKRARSLPLMRDGVWKA